MHQKSELFLKLKKKGANYYLVMDFTLLTSQRGVLIIFRWFGTNYFICPDSIYMKGQFEMGRSFMNKGH